MMSSLTVETFLLPSTPAIEPSSTAGFTKAILGLITASCRERAPCVIIPLWRIVYGRGKTDVVEEVQLKGSSSTDRITKCQLTLVFRRRSGG